MVRRVIEFDLVARVQTVQMSLDFQWTCLACHRNSCRLFLTLKSTSHSHNYSLKIQLLAHYPDQTSGYQIQTALCWTTLLIHCRKCLRCVERQCGLLERTLDWDSGLVYTGNSEKLIQIN